MLMRGYPMTRKRPRASIPAQVYRVGTNAVRSVSVFNPFSESPDTRFYTSRRYHLSQCYQSGVSIRSSATVGLKVATSIDILYRRVGMYSLERGHKFIVWENYIQIQTCLSRRTRGDDGLIQFLWSYRCVV